VIRILAPLMIPESQLDRALDVLEECVMEVAAEVTT